MVKEYYMHMVYKRVAAVLSNPVARNSAVMFVGMMATNFGAYLYQVIVIRILGLERYSEFAALISLLFLMSVPANVLQFVLTKYFSIYKVNGELGQARNLFIKTLKLIGIVSFVGFFVFIPLIPILENILHFKSTASYIYLFIIVVATFIVTLNAALLNGYQKFFASSSILTINTFVRVLTGVLLAPFGVAMALLGNVAANVVSMVFYYASAKFLFAVPAKPIRIQKREVWDFAFPTLLSTLSMTAFFNMDVVLVKHFFTSTEAGVYSTLTLFGKIVYFAASPIMIVIFPMIIEKIEQKKNHTAYFSLGFLGVFLLSFSLVGIYAVFPEFIINRLFGERFLIAVPYLASYGVFMAFVTLANYLMTVCLAVNKTKAGFIMLLGAIAHTGVIVLFHNTISQVILSISIVMGLLTGLLLLYYMHNPARILWSAKRSQNHEPRNP